MLRRFRDSTSLISKTFPGDDEHAQRFSPADTRLFINCSEDRVHLPIICFQFEDFAYNSGHYAISTDFWLSFRGRRGGGARVENFPRFSSFPTLSYDSFEYFSLLILAG